MDRLFCEKSRRNVSHEKPSGRKDKNVEKQEEVVGFMSTECEKSFFKMTEFCEKFTAFSGCMEEFVEQLHSLSGTTACILS
jgi:hypothetical protein